MVNFVSKIVLCDNGVCDILKERFVTVIEIIIRAIFLFYSDWYFSEFSRFFPSFFFFLFEFPTDALSSILLIFLIALSHCVYSSSAFCLEPTLTKSLYNSNP